MQQTLWAYHNQYFFILQATPGVIFLTIFSIFIPPGGLYPMQHNSTIRKKQTKGMGGA